MASYLWPMTKDGTPTGTQITDVLDGDTIDALFYEPVAFGDALQRRRRLRLARINAAKGPTGTGRLATRELESILRGAGNPVVALVTLKPYKFGGPAGAYRGSIPGGPKDYGGEYMVEVELADGRMVSDVMVAEGHALYWDGTGPRPGDDG